MAMLAATIDAWLTFEGRPIATSLGFALLPTLTRPHYDVVLRIWKTRLWIVWTLGLTLRPLDRIGMKSR